MTQPTVCNLINPPIPNVYSRQRMNTGITGSNSKSRSLTQNINRSTSNNNARGHSS